MAKRLTPKTVAALPTPAPVPIARDMRQPTCLPACRSRPAPEIAAW
jgi:hypothetical protein